MVNFTILILLKKFIIILKMSGKGSSSGKGSGKGSGSGGAFVGGVSSGASASSSISVSSKKRNYEEVADGDIQSMQEASVFNGGPGCAPGTIEPVAAEDNDDYDDTELVFNEADEIPVSELEDFMKTNSPIKVSTKEATKIVEHPHMKLIRNVKEIQKMYPVTIEVCHNHLTSVHSHCSLSLSLSLSLTLSLCLSVHFD